MTASSESITINEVTKLPAFDTSAACNEEIDTEPPEALAKVVLGVPNANGDCPLIFELVESAALPTFTVYVLVVVPFCAVTT